MIDQIRIATRRSPLAMWQTNYIADALRHAHPGLDVEVVGIDTTGDKIRDKPLPKIGTKGLFTRELEDALLSGAVHLAVHSLKDLPTTLPPGLAYGGSPTRAAATDCLVMFRHDSLDALPDDAVVATGSVRRRAQLRSLKPGVRFEELRGNIDTRLRKLEEQGWDAIVMATAALHRLGRPELVSAELDPATMVPAPGQGAIGLEVAEDADDVRELLAAILDQPTMTAVSAERDFMRALEGGCSVPLGAHSRKVGTDWEFHGWIGSPGDNRVMRDVARGPAPGPLARAMAEDFLRRGAAEVLGR